MKLRLVVGDKNLSSWSMRPYLALRLTGVPFDEDVVLLDRPDTARRIAAWSPSGRVPVLVDGDVRVWDSLAIVEYLAEKLPDAGLWPADRAARAMARSACAEMHSGFSAMRSAMSMNVKARRPLAVLAPEARRDVDRIEALWRSCRERSGGPFLFGAFGAADCFFAPVVSRFVTYAPEVAADTHGYVDAVLAHPVVAGWIREAEAEAERTGSHLRAH